MRLETNKHQSVFAYYTCPVLTTVTVTGSTHSIAGAKRYKYKYMMNINSNANIIFWPATNKLFVANK